MRFSIQRGCFMAEARLSGLACDRHGDHLEETWLVSSCQSYESYEEIRCEPSDCWRSLCERSLSDRGRGITTLDAKRSSRSLAARAASERVEFRPFATSPLNSVARKNEKTRKKPLVPRVRNNRYLGKTEGVEIWNLKSNHMVRDYIPVSFTGRSVICFSRREEARRTGTEQNHRMTCKANMRYTVTLELENRAKVLWKPKTCHKNHENRNQQ